MNNWLKFIKHCLHINFHWMRLCNLTKKNEIKIKLLKSFFTQFWNTWKRCVFNIVRTKWAVSWILVIIGFLASSALKVTAICIVRSYYTEWIFSQSSSKYPIPKITVNKQVNKFSNLNDGNIAANLLSRVKKEHHY